MNIDKPSRSTDLRKRCVFLTMENPAGFYIYDELAFGPLSELGWDAVEIPWSSASTDWSLYDVVVIRSTWDYQNHVTDFMERLAFIEQSGPLLFNPLSICRWNLNKTYLRELQSRGVPIVPTLWIDNLAKDDLSSISRSLHSERMVVKPIVGANADDTYCITNGSLDGPTGRALEVFAQRPCMVQPFIDSVREVGEYSLFYFGGEYSHAILKRPAQGDFRVQEEHGGTITPHEADADLRTQAQQVLRAIEKVLLYARVDFVRLANGKPVVMEVELIEPSLYFSYDSESPGRFARALDSLYTAERCCGV